MALEIERKFLLKRIPEINWSNIYEIEQYYCQKPKLRIRHVYDLETQTRLFIQTKKTLLRPGVYEEDEETISEKRFLTLQKTADRWIKKTRYVKAFPRVKWEVDSFDQFRLVVAEVEMPIENYRLTIPSFIQDTLIKEVTEFPEFTNRNLAEVWPEK